MTDLHTLTYVSTAASGLGRPSLEAILQVARARNAAEDLTGALIFGEDRFLQTLEGPKAGLERVYASIETDRRHHGVMIIRSAPLDVRKYDGWSMAMVEHADAPELLRADLRQLHKQAMISMVGDDREAGLLEKLQTAVARKIQAHLGTPGLSC